MFRPIQQTACGCRPNGRPGEDPTALAGHMGFVALTPGAAGPAGAWWQDWRNLALVAAGALLIYALLFRKSDRERRKAKRAATAKARARYQRELEGITERFA